MPSQKNINQLSILKTKISAAKSVVFSNYHGLTVPQIQELKTKVKAAKGEFTVAKNTLLKLALKKKHGNKLNDTLTGPTAILFTSEDEIGPIKSLAEFSKATNNIPEIKAGILDDRILTAQEVSELAKLPGRTELQSKLTGTLSTPLYGLINVLRGNLRGLVQVLIAYKNQKEKEVN